MIINKGKIVAEGTPAELKDQYSFDRLKIVAKDKKLMMESLEKMNKPYEKIADQFIMIVNDAEEAITLINLLRSNIAQFEMVKGTMDDVFIQVIGGENHV